MKVKTAFIITWIIIENSFAVMMISPWLTPRMWLSTRLHITAFTAMFCALITFAIYMIYKDEFNKTEK